MADINVDYQAISTVAGLLNSAESNITPQISNMYTQVDNLLTEAGGLWLDKATPAILQVYGDFNSSAQQVCSAIGNFATTFQTLVSNFQSMDQNLSISISGTAVDTVKGTPPS